MNMWYGICKHETYNGECPFDERFPTNKPSQLNDDDEDNKLDVDDIMQSIGFERVS